jgi:hypothetical protein
MDVEQEVERLVGRVRELEDRLRDLEGDRGSDQLDSAIGFEVSPSDDFDEDESEYRQVPERRVPKPGVG